MYKLVYTIFKMYIVLNLERKRIEISDIYSEWRANKDYTILHKLSLNPSPLADGDASLKYPLF